MKIKKGLSLTQFIDLLNHTTVNEMVIMMGKNYHKFIPIKIFNYNDFLKQPLHKGLFTPCDDEGNEIEKPIKPMSYDEWKCGNGMADGIACVNYENELKKYKEAEKKVIFKDDKVYLDDDYPGCVCIKGGGAIPFGWELSKLFEATNGELETQNINI